MQRDRLVEGVVGEDVQDGRERLLPYDVGLFADPDEDGLDVRGGRRGLGELGLASRGLYTYLLPMAHARGLGGWGFALVWARGIGGVLGSGLIGRPLDAWGPRRLLPLAPAFLLTAFLVVRLTDAPAAWLVATAVWGASGWTSVPVLQQALTRDRTDEAVAIVAVQMAAMYLGSAAGSAAGSALLATGVTAGTLAWLGRTASRLGAPTGPHGRPPDPGRTPHRGRPPDAARGNRAGTVRAENPLTD